MIYTDEMEKQVSAGTRYRDCFRGADGRRTEIVCMTWLAQTMSGTALGGLSAFFYQQAGISTSDSFKLSWGQSGLNAVGTMFSWAVLERIGRKTLMLGGMSVMFVLLMYVALLPPSPPSFPPSSFPLSTKFSPCLSPTTTHLLVHLSVCVSDAFLMCPLFRV